MYLPTAASASLHPRQATWRANPLTRKQNRGRFFESAAPFPLSMNNSETVWTWCSFPSEAREIGFAGVARRCVSESGCVAAREGVASTDRACHKCESCSKVLGAPENSYKPWSGWACSELLLGAATVAHVFQTELLLRGFASGRSGTKEPSSKVQALNCAW